MKLIKFIFLPLFAVWASAASAQIACDLCVAAFTDNLDEINRLVAEGADLEETWNGRTALHYAAAGGNVNIVNVLTAAGADADARDIIGQSPLHLAANGKHAAAVNALIAAGANINTADNNGNAPLHIAAGRGDADSARALIAGGANVNAAGAGGFAPLHFAAREGQDAAARVLLAAGADLNAVNDDGITPLQIAVQNGHAELIDDAIAEVAAAAPSANGKSTSRLPSVGVFLLFTGLFLTSGENADFTPAFGYSATESGYAANAGGHFYKDKWRLYARATNGDFGGFRYESGGKYTADLWTATFSESVRGETAGYDFSLSADFRGGVWSLSPMYRLHSEFSDGETETRNSLYLESAFIRNRWTIKPSASFNWQNEREFAENVKFRLNAVHRF